MRCTSACATSGFARSIALDTTTTSAPATFSARWPTNTVATERLEPARDGPGLEVTALHGVAEVGQHLGDSASCRCRRYRRSGWCGCGACRSFIAHLPQQRRTRRRGARPASVIAMPRAAAAICARRGRPASSNSRSVAASDTGVSCDFGEQPGGAAAHHVFGIAGLVVVHRGRNGTSTAGTPAAESSATVSAPGAAHRQVGPAVGAGHVVDERPHVGLDAARLVGRQPSRRNRCGPVWWINSGRRDSGSSAIRRRTTRSAAPRPGCHRRSAGGRGLARAGVAPLGRRHGGRSPDVPGADCGCA